MRDPGKAHPGGVRPHAVTPVSVAGISGKAPLVFARAIAPADP